MAVTPINDQERWNSIYLFDLIFLKGMAKFLKEKTFNFLNTYKNKYVIKIFIIIDLFANKKMFAKNSGFLRIFSFLRICEYLKKLKIFANKFFFTNIWNFCKNETFWEVIQNPLK